MQDNMEFQKIDPNPRSTAAKKAIIAVISVLLVAVLAVTAGLLIRHYVVATFIVDGASMWPTLDGGNGAETEGKSEEELTNGDVLYLNMLAKIKRGDIVVFTPGWEALKDSDGSDPSLVKRVIAVAGDRISIVHNVVYLNGQPQKEDYVSDIPIARDYNLDETVIPDGYIFCMGDNRAASADSREFGAVPLSCVVGKCFMIKTRDGKLKWVK